MKHTHVPVLLWPGRRWLADLDRQLRLQKLRGFVRIHVCVFWEFLLLWIWDWMCDRWLSDTQGYAHRQASGGLCLALQQCVWKIMLNLYFTMGYAKYLLFCATWLHLQVLRACAEFIYLYLHLSELFLFLVHHFLLKREEENLKLVHEGSYIGVISRMDVNSSVSKWHLLIYLNGRLTQ